MIALRIVAAALAASVVLAGAATAQAQARGQTQTPTQNQAQAQAQAQTPAQAVPRMPDGKPDFSGIYTAPSTVNATGPRGNLIFNADKMAPVKPGAESLLYQQRTGDARIDEPRAACMPSGFPSGMLYILPIQIV